MLAVANGGSPSAGAANAVSEMASTNGSRMSMLTGSTTSAPPPPVRVPPCGFWLCCCLRPVSMLVIIDMLVVRNLGYCDCLA